MDALVRQHTWCKASWSCDKVSLGRMQREAPNRNLVAEPARLEEPAKEKP